MLKKLILGLAIGLLTTSSFAQATNEVINFSKGQSKPISLWVIDYDGSSFSAATGKPDTIIVYNRLTRAASSSLASDPIRVNCNGTPVIVAPGTSYTCNIQANGAFIVSSEPGFFKNGAEGALVELGSFH